MLCQYGRIYNGRMSRMGVLNIEKDVLLIVTKLIDISAYQF